jgi:transmembrane protein 216
MYCSSTYELLLYLNSFHFVMFAFCKFGMGIFKAVYHLYPSGTIISELLLLLFLCCNEYVRAFTGHKGNSTRRCFAVLVSIGLTIPSILGMMCFLTWQTHVLRIEVLICYIKLTLQGLELAFALLCLASFYRSGTY